jgi:hypothetical protein
MKVAYSQLRRLRIAVLYNRSIVDLDNYDLRVDPGMTNADAASNLLKPFDTLVMRSYPVSSRVNHAANDDEGCSMPVKFVETPS